MRNRVTGLVLSLALLVIVLVGSCANVMPVNTNVDSTLPTTQSIFGSTMTVPIPPNVTLTIIPRTEWQDITSIYTNETRPINVKVGERFLIRYDMAENDMFPTFDAVYDTKVIESLGTAAMPLEQAPYYAGWLCFQALKTGSTQITVLHESWHFATNPAEPNLLEQKVFQVNITG